MAIKYSNGHEIYQHLQFKGPPKFGKNGIIGLKRNHLASLVGGDDGDTKNDDGAPVTRVADQGPMLRY
jgi:hypothetical protein